MPPFSLFRMWLREGPLGERVAAAVAVVVVLGLVGLALVPVTTGSGGGLAVIAQSSGGAAGPTGSTSVNPGSAANPQPITASNPSQPASTPGSPAPAAGSAGVGATNSAGPTGPAPSGTGPSGAGPSGTGPSGQGPGSSSACAGLRASAPGVTATEVHVDIALVDLAGGIGNATFHIRSDQTNIINAVVSSVNKSGGVACGRKLVVKQYKVNPIDTNDQQSKCLQMVQDNPLAVINGAGYVTPVSQNCFVQNHLPLETETSIGAQQGKSSYPYLFSPLASSEEQVRDGILGLAAHGVFREPKFAKIGLLEDNCLPSANQEIGNDLASSGVKPNQISTYVLDCNLLAPPNQVAQAVVQQKVAGATHVFLASSILNNENYVQAAAQQNFHPRYLVSDYGSASNAAGSWDPSFDGALAITSTRSGELNSGIHAPAEITCNNLLVSQGVKGISSEQNDGTAASLCDLLFFFAQAINHAGPNPTRLGLLQGLASMGHFSSAYVGDSTWSTPGKLSGGDFQREIGWHSSCGCFKVIDPSFGPGY